LGDLNCRVFVNLGAFCLAEFGLARVPLTPLNSSRRALSNGGIFECIESSFENRRVFFPRLKDLKRTRIATREWLLELEAAEATAPIGSDLRGGLLSLRSFKNLYE
jgi:hypothetical protein